MRVLSTCALVGVMVLAGCTGGNGSGSGTDSSSTGTSSAPNIGPVAAFTIGYTGLTVTVNAAASTDADGVISTYSWRWGDGTPNTTGATKTATHAYLSTGQYTITLTVTDNGGSTSSMSQTITVPTGTATGTASSTSTSSSSSSSSSSSTSSSSTSTSSGTIDATPPEIAAYTFAVMGPNSLRANWTVYNDGAPVASVIKYQKAADFDTSPLLSAGSQSTEGDKSFTITGLTACTAYKARIEATDSAGNTAISDTLQATTNGSTPTITAGTPLVSSVMHNSLTISYTVTGTADLTSKVVFGLTSSYGNVVQASNGPGTKTVTLTGLAPDTNYNYLIQAQSQCGFTEGPGVNNIQKTAKLVHIDINTVPPAGTSPCFYPGTTYTVPPGCTGSGAPTCPTTGAPQAGSLCLDDAGQALVFEIKNNHSAAHSWGISGVTPAYSSGSIAAGATVILPSSITLTAGNYAMTGTGISAAANLHLY